MSRPALYEMTNAFIDNKLDTYNPDIEVWKGTEAFESFERVYEFAIGRSNLRESERMTEIKGRILDVLQE